MKKFITAIAFTIASISSIFAGGNDISKNVQATFTATYAKASNAVWEKTDNYYKVSFQLNGQSLSALLSNQGEMIAVSRNILSYELPILLQSSLDIDLSSSWITGLVEYAVDNRTVYYATVENAHQTIIYESTGYYGWTILKTTAK
jgi:hypothetical protein